MTGAHLRIKALIALVAGCALLVGVPAPTEAAIDASTEVATEAGPRTAARKRPRCLWHKRNCHPPARLWYRVEVKLDGGQSFHWVNPETNSRTEVAHANTTEQDWELRSNTAVRLTLGCVDVGLDDEPFLLKRRINGKRRTIGGYGKNAPRPLAPTVRFAANATGEVTSWQQTESVGPWENKGVWACPGWETHDELTTAQGLAGQIGSASSIGDGVLIWAGATAPFGNIHQSFPGYECEPLQEGVEPPVIPPREQDLDFGHADIDGGDPTLGICDDSLGWTPLWER